MRLSVKNIYKSKYFHVATCLFLVFFAALIMLPYLAAERHTGHDIKYHFTVIRSLSVAWEQGSFGSKVMELIGGDYGYGTGIFYSTFPASFCVILMKLFSCSMITALYFELFLLFGAAALIVYWFFVRVFRDSRTAVIGALIYMTFPYFLWDVYVRFAFTEVFLMLALPLIAWGVYELLYNANKAAFFALFITGYVLAIFSHFTMTVYITLFVGMWLLLEGRKTFKAATLGCLVIATGIVLLITASYYLPMLVNFGVTNTESMKKTPEKMFENTSKYYTERILSFDFWFSICAFAAYFFYYFKVLDKDGRTAGKRALLLSSVAIVLLYNPYFPWSIMPDFLMMIQYTFRIFLISGIVVPLMFGCMVTDIFFKKRLLEKMEAEEAEPAEVTAEGAELTPKKRTLAERWKGWKPSKNFVPTVILSLCLACCGLFACVHNIEIMEGVDNAGPYGDDAMLDVTGHSEYLGLGAGKNGDYFPLDCKGFYLSTRLKKLFVRSTNMSISELSVYNGLSQVSFLVSKTEKEGYALLNLPYESFEGVEVYRVETKSTNKQLPIEAVSESNGKYVRIETGVYNGDSKIILQYKAAPAFKAWLEEEAFGVLTLEGDAVASDLKKEYAGKYSLAVNVGEEGGVLELPSLYYKGYTLKFVNESGKISELTPTHGRNGFVEVAVQENGRLYVEFASGYLTFSSVLTWIGVAAFVGVVALTVLLDIKKRAKAS